MSGAKPEDFLHTLLRDHSACMEIAENLLARLIVSDRTSSPQVI